MRREAEFMIYRAIAVAGLGDGVDKSRIAGVIRTGNKTSDARWDD